MPLYIKLTELKNSKCIDQTKFYNKWYKKMHIFEIPGEGQVLLSPPLWALPWWVPLFVNFIITMNNHFGMLKIRKFIHLGKKFVFFIAYISKLHDCTHFNCTQMQASKFLNCRLIQLKFTFFTGNLHNFFYGK